MNRIKLIDHNRPVLLIRPDQESNYLSQAALSLQSELLDCLRGTNFEEASTKTIKLVLGLSKKGIERLISLNGSSSIVSTDTFDAESIINESLDELAQVLNEAMSELKMRSAENEDDFRSYIGELDLMIDTCVNWSNGDFTAESNEISLIFD